MNDLTNRLADVGIFLNQDQQANFRKYIELILSWNKRINLISRQDESQLVENHIFESLTFLLSFQIMPGMKIVDIGCGAGFPGLPIRMIQEDADFLLVESKRKRALFLKEVVLQLGLKNVTVLSERAESLAQNSKYENCFDFAFSRAVASLEVVYGWVEKLMKQSGVYVAWKGGAIEPEIEQLLKKNVKVELIPMDARLVKSEKNRILVCVKRCE